MKTKFIAGMQELDNNLINDMFMCHLCAEIDWCLFGSLTYKAQLREKQSVQRTIEGKTTEMVSFFQSFIKNFVNIFSYIKEVNMREKITHLNLRALYLLQIGDVYT